MLGVFFAISMIKIQSMYQNIKYGGAPFLDFNEEQIPHAG
jgi:hypothetical protein